MGATVLSQQTGAHERQQLFDDLQVRFRGVKVAAVYPEQLPNLAAGSQQVLVGRYLPEGKDQSGEVIVSGNRGGESVRYAARISLQEAEQGNSFIPRLWARARLENLLAQGANPVIRDEIIALSEERLESKRLQELEDRRRGRSSPSSATSSLM